MTRVRISRQPRLPDPLRVARSLRAPELGPRILFFSGGSALRPLSRTLKLYTHNSVHLITAFDSGGSSAHLRRAFAMPAIGDLRNRITALADESVRGNPQIYRLFSHRMSATATEAELEAEFAEMVSGPHFLVEEIPEPMRQIIRTHLRFFAERRPGGFDLRGANIGNLMLAGAFLANSRDLNSALFLFSKLLEVRGAVRPIVDVDLHLSAELSNGTRIVGQHALTNWEGASPTAKVQDLQLVTELQAPEPATARIRDDVRGHIETADLICFPMGSFYSSVVATLLPGGVGTAVAAAGCPRVYVPSTGFDPEQRGMSVADSVEALLRVVRQDSGDDTPAHHIVNLVLLDRNSSHYAIPIERGRIEKLGIDVVALDLVSERSLPQIDPERLTESLLSLT